MVALTASMAVANLHTYLVGPLAPFWQRDLGLTAVQIGALATAVVLVAALVSTTAGSLVDTWGGRPLLLGLYALVAVGLVIMAGAPSLPVLLAGAALGGAGQAVSNPATNQLAAAHTASGSRGSSVGIKQSGVQAGGFVVGLVVPTAVTAFGWRPVLIAAAVLATTIGVSTIGFVPAAQPTPIRPAPSSGGREPVRVRSVAALVLASFFVGAGVEAVLTYTPLYAVSMGESPRVGGLVVSVTALVGIGGRIAWSTVAGRVRDVSRVLTVLGVVAAASAGLLLLAASVGTWMLWLASVLHGLSASSWNAPLMVAVIRRLSGLGIGRATGMVQTAFLAGLVTSPLLMGWIVDATGGYGIGWAIMAAAFACAAVSTWRW